MELHRHTYQEFLLHGHALPKAPKGLRKHTLFHGLIFGKLLVIGHVAGVANHWGFKLKCRCLCGSKRGRNVWERDLLSGKVTDCGCRAAWKEKKRRAVAKKKSLAAREIERLAEHGRNVTIQTKSLQCQAAAKKRWADHDVKSTEESKN
jgi:hypothetical protein